MKADIKKRWIDALESGTYPQGRHTLHRSVPTGQDEYCCLGVLCDLAYQDGVVDRNLVGRHYGYGESGQVEKETLDLLELPDEVMAWAGLTRANPTVYTVDNALSSLAAINDSGVPFTEIANIIREQL